MESLNEKFEILKEVIKIKQNPVEKAEEAIYDYKENRQEKEDYIAICYILNKCINAINYLKRQLEEKNNG